MNRKDFIRLSSLSALATTMQFRDLEKWLDATHRGASPMMPALFIGHGSPMNALEDNPFTQSLNRTGATIRKECLPRAILVVSAHWLTRGTFICKAEKPETIHDFGGFPDELFAMQYPAPGSPTVAAEVKQLLPEAALTDEWGLDHGAWTILHHLFPQADIPVFQVSIDYYRPMSWHFELAKQIKSLREKGVLILGSGNIVHNLRMSMQALASGDSKPHDWAVEFDTWVKQNIEGHNYTALFDYASAGKAGNLSVPTPDHYIPMLYTLGASDPAEPLTTIFEEVSYGGLSMRSFLTGG